MDFLCLRRAFYSYYSPKSTLLLLPFTALLLLLPPITATAAMLSPCVLTRNCQQYILYILRIQQHFWIYNISSYTIPIL